MANITETATYDAAVPQLETTTAAAGGPGGAMNSQAQALANRTKYLKGILDSPAALAALVQDATTSAKGVTQLASTGVESATKVPKALGADLVALITAAGYTLNPATGTASLDGIADGTTYKRVQATPATALNASTIVAGTQWGSGNDGNGGQPPAPKPKAYSSNGISEWYLLNSAENADLVLPAGGKWAYFGWLRSSTNNTVPSYLSYITVSVVAGGTIIVAAGGAGTFAQSMVYRVE